MLVIGTTMAQTAKPTRPESLLLASLSFHILRETMASPGFYETLTSALSRREVKTPMAFYSRVLWVAIALILGPLYSSLEAKLQVILVSIGIALAVGVCVWVSFFAWKKPEYLLFEAETHFQRWRISYGTEMGTASPKELQAPGTGREPTQPAQS